VKYIPQLTKSDEQSLLLQREAVEAQLWKQQVEGSLQQIHNKVPH
jgi:hypothetical protein